MRMEAFAEGLRVRFAAQIRPQMRGSIGRLSGQIAPSRPGDLSWATRRALLACKAPF